MHDPTRPVQLGNLYAIAAAVIAVMIPPGQTEPVALRVDRDGTITLVGLQDEDPANLLDAPGFVGWLSAETDQTRLAQRLAAAHAKVGAA